MENKLLEQAKDEIAKKHDCKDWYEILQDHLFMDNKIVDEVAVRYAELLGQSKRISIEHDLSSIESYK